MRTTKNTFFREGTRMGAKKIFFLGGPLRTTKNTFFREGTRRGAKNTFLSGWTSKQVNVVWLFYSRMPRWPRFMPTRPPSTWRVVPVM